MGKILLFFAVCAAIVAIPAKLAFGDPAPDGAGCAVTVTVNTIIEWEGDNFPALAPAAITVQNSTPTDSGVFTLWINGDVSLSANNTATAQLASATDTLVTKYKLSTDGDGDPATGAIADAVELSDSDEWTLHGDFLGTPLDITHVNTDGNVEITLYVQASNDTDEVSDAGAYSAAQTITATWNE